jgi:hypothetical protein
VEALERRELLTGSWQPVASGFHYGDTMLLLSDGSVMIHSYGPGPTPYWSKLTPDAHGSYANGTFTGLSPMNLARQFFSSDVLPDGRVLVLGGEYTGFNSALTDTNTGEVYNPATDSWSPIANFPEAHFGDGPTEVLPDGRVLAGYLAGSQTYIYDPASNSWSAGGSLLYGDTSAEEGWVKTPGGAILTYELSGTAQQTAQRYLPGANVWYNGGSVPVQLASNGGNPAITPEIGPGVLLPDGWVFWAGASGHTALYNSVTGVWVTGPDIPGGLGAFDAPGAVEPSGRVLFTAGPIDGYNFSGPTTVMEYDPVYQTISVVPPGAGLNLSGQEAQSRMLVLPSGQILFSTGTQIYVYDPDSSPNPAWAPTISNIVNNGDGTYTLTGTQLNGMTEGATYGDDGEMASNYPLLGLTGADGTYQFARTFNWSSTDVQTGSTPVSTQFTLPGGATHGAFLLQAIANGIGSGKVLAVFTDAADNTVTLRRDPANPASFYQVLDGATSLGSFAIGKFNAVQVITDSANATVNVQDTIAGVPLTVNGRAYDQVVIGKNGSVQGIQGDVYLQNPVYYNALTVDDSADATARGVTFSTSGDGLWGSITGMAPAAIHYQLSDTAGQIVVKGGPATGNIYTVAGGASFQTIYLNAGAGADVINVLATSGILNIDGGGNNTVIIGNGSLGAINGPVNVSDTGGAAQLIVNDLSDPAGHTVSVYDGSLSGLAPAAISWTPTATGNGGVTGLTIDGGTGSSTYNVFNTSNFGPTGSTVLRAGHGSASENTVNIESTKGALYVDGADAFQQVLVGSNANYAAGTLAGINGPVQVYNSNPNGSSNLTLDDSLDVTARTAVLYQYAVAGLSPAPIEWAGSASATGGVTQLKILGSAAGSTYTVTSTPVLYFGTNLKTGTGNDVVNIQGTAGSLYLYNNGGSDAVVVGSKAPSTSGGTLAGIGGFVYVYGAGSTALVVDDSGDTAVRTPTLTGVRLTGLSPQPIYFGGGVTSLTVNGGSAADTYDVEATPAGMTTTLNGGPANDTFLVCPTYQVLDAIAGPLAINAGGGAANTVTITDTSAAAAHAYTVTGDTGLSRGSAAPITYTAVKSVAVNGGVVGGNVFNVAAAPVAVALKLNGGGTSDTLIGPSANETWIISGANAGNLGSKVLFTAMQNLEGGTGNDTFKFTASGSVDGFITGGGGMNKLDYSADGGSYVGVNLASGAASRIHGGASGGFYQIQSLVGSTGYDTLLGPNADTTWTISSAGGGKAGTVSFSGFEELVGGAGVSVFKFTGSGSIDMIVGGPAPAGTGNWLDYSALTVPVTVNLENNSATRVGGGVAGRVFSIQNVHGSNGGSLLIGNGQGNILIGGTGADTLLGGSGASILIGDKGSDTVTGGSGSDILIGDYTSYDAMTTANEKALMAILAEWQRTDESYNSRFQHINTGEGGVNGTAKLNFGLTVKSDGTADVLSGNYTALPGDWFFLSVYDAGQYWQPGEHINNT